MGIGLGVVLVLAGLVLVSGVLEFDIDFVQDTTLGWILLGVGVLSIVLSFALNHQRSNRTTTVEETRVER